MTSNQKAPQHFYCLDAIRAIAAIIVVIYHWQLFGFANDQYVLDYYNKDTLPWESAFSFIYHDAIISVDLFFLLSGFIFFWLYADRVASQKIGFGKFMGYRLSRLYPVHLLSLLLVAVLQWLMLRNTGHFFIIQFNDAYHFVLNLLFMQNWGFEKGPSFNGPSWSASAEVFLYLVFFAVCFLKLQKKIWLLAFLAIAGTIMQYTLNVLGKGMFSFFLGALVYYIYTWMMKENKVKQFLPWLAGITVVLWIYMFVEYYTSFTQNIWTNLFIQKTGKDPVAAIKAWAYFRNQFFRTAVSPFTVLTLVLWESTRSIISKRWTVLGNASYAMYLIHFPLQIIFVLVVDSLHISRTIFSSPAIMLLFFLILIPLSIFLYYRFEMPVQDKLRSMLFKSNKPRITITDVEVTT